MTGCSGGEAAGCLTAVSRSISMVRRSASSIVVSANEVGNDQARKCLIPEWAPNAPTACQGLKGKVWNRLRRASPALAWKFARNW